MKINHKYDVYGRTEPSIIYLAKPGKRLFCALGGIDSSTVSLSLKTNNTAELTFTVDKYINNALTDGYEELDELMELYCDGIWFKIVDPPTISNNGMRETKEITAESYEIMLTQYKLKNFKINMGEEDSYEMMYQATHDKSKFYQIKFYDPDNEDLSFLHLVLKHADVPGWKIGYVDNITPDDDGKLLPNNICNFEVDDQNVYAFLTQEAAQGYKCVFEFDTVNMTINVYRPDSLGKDTNVVLGFRNIQNSVTISRDENLVTQFYVEGLDDYNIDAVNFGDSVITDLSYFIREPYMDTSLQEKYNAWQSYRESRREEFINLSKEYNKNLEVLTELMNRVPIDTAQTNWFGKKVEDLKDAYNANMAIIKGLEALYVDDEKNFDLEALKKSHDWPLYESIMNYTLPSIVAALQAQDETVEGFGKGNIISCVNPIVLGQDWYMVNPGTSSFQTIQIDDAPAYGITRGVKVTGTNGGIYQHNISIEPSQRYTLSCFVKGSGTFYLGYNNTGEDRKNISYNITSSWTRVYTSFNLSSRLIDVAFTGTNDFTICGMQLEMGDSPSQFGYFTQSENIIKAYETDWKLYGISELKVKISTYDSCIKELKKSGYADGYNPLSGYEEAYFTQMHQKYLDYLNLKDQAEAALKERQAEYDKAKKPEIQEKRNQIAKDVLLENFGKIQNKYSAFTDKETYIIKSLYSQSTYTNENIIVTTLDSTADAVDKSKVLYDDALEELYVESHPQYTYTDDVENVYALPEFKEYHEQLAVNDFVRVGITDTNYIKLRVIEITYNPCDLDESMEITFSNMIQYKAKRNDYNTLLNDALNTSNRNGGRVNSVNKSSTSDYVITSDAIKQIFSNPLFNSMLGGATTGGTGSGGTITADMIVAELVKAKEGVFDKLTVDTAFMKYLDVKLISADKITTRILEAEQANIEKLSAKIIESNQINADMINVKNLLAGNAGVGNLQAVHLTAQNVTIDQAVITDLIAKKMTVADLNTHTATADEFMIISSGKAGIAFKNSTQQFYDSTGAVRVQIGQDGTGKFNFVVKNGDKTALFDENGITQTGIPDNTIVNNMISDGTINKEKLSFTMVEPNEQGGIDISQVYLDGKKFGQQYTSFKDQTTEQITNITDPQKGQIVQSIQNSLFNEDGSSIYTKHTEYKQTVDGITQTVSNNKLDTDKKLDAASTSITQTADKLNLIATGGTGESKLELTPDFINLVSSKVVGIKADQINIDGVITAINTNGTTAGKTQIDAGAISTENVNALLIKTGKLKSNNYKDPSNTSPLYSQAGTLIDMENGAITSKNFSIDTSGEAHFKGNGEFGGKISANSGYIGGEKGFVIEAGKLYSGLKDFPTQYPSSISTNKNVYVGINGIALGDGNFMVDSNGKMYANQGEFTGKITANDGFIGGWIISSNSLTANNGSISISPDGIHWGDYLNINSQGATFKGHITATSGSFTGDVIANSLTLGPGSTVNGLSYNDLNDRPNIPSDLSGYITVDGKIGIIQNEDQEIPSGATGFKVSKNGLLQASNAIISGTIYASSGTFAGDVTAKTMTAKQSYSIYYNDVNGVPTDSREIIYATNWGISSGDLRFGLSDECGYMISTDVLGKNTLKIMGQNLLVTSPMQIQSSCLVQSQFVIDTKNGSIPYQNLKWTPSNKDGVAISSGFFSYNGYGHNHTILPNTEGNCAIGIGDVSADSDVSATWCIMPYKLYTENSYVDNSNGIPTVTSISRDTSASINVGSSDNQFNSLYVKKIYLNGKLLTSTGNNTGTSDYGSLTNKPQINGHTLASGNNTLNTLGIAARSHSHSSSDINWSTTLGYKGFDHNHTMIYDGKGLKGISIAGSESPSYMGLIPYDVTYTNVNSISLTRGGTMYLGAAYNSNKLTAYPFECGYFKNIKVYKGSGDTSNIDNYITPSGGGSISLKIDGTTYSSGFTNYNLATQDWVNGKGYLTQHQSLYGYATTSWVTSNFAAKGSGGGTTYSAGTGITISGTTISVTSGVYASSSHSHEYIIKNSVGLKSDGASKLLPASSSSSYSGNTIQLGSSGYYFTEVHAKTFYGKLSGSDERIKHSIFDINPKYKSFFLDIQPKQFMYKNLYSFENHDRVHTGVIAQQCLEAMEKNGISINEYGLINHKILDSDDDNLLGLKERYYVEYSELHGIEIAMIQDNYHRIESLISENQSLKNEILMLQGQLSLINQRLQKLEEKAC